MQERQALVGSPHQQKAELGEGRYCMESSSISEQKHGIHSVIEVLVLSSQIRVSASPFLHSRIVQLLNNRQG